MQVFSTLFPFLHNALYIFWGQDGHLRLHPGTLTQDLLLKAIYSFTTESLSVAYKHNKLYMLPFLSGPIAQIFRLYESLGNTYVFVLR